MSIEFVCICAIVGWILTLFVLFTTFLGAFKDTETTGTWVIPLYMWCSVRHVLKGTLLAFALGVQTVVMAWATLTTDPTAALTTVIGLLSITSTVSTVIGYVLVIVLWRRAEGKWAPSLVTATHNSYCLGCGHPVRSGKLMGGYCPVCGADPDMQCDRHRHKRFKKTGDPNITKTRRKGKEVAK